MATIRRKTGDTRTLRTVVSSAGSPVDVAGASVEFRMKPAIEGQGPTVHAAGAVYQAVDGATGAILNKGLIGYSPAPGDVAEPGTYRIEWHVTLADGSTPVFPSDGYDTLILDPAL